MNAILEKYTDRTRRAILPIPAVREALGLADDATLEIVPTNDGKGGFNVVVVYTAPDGAALPVTPVAPVAPEVPRRTRPKPPPVLVGPPAETEPVAPATDDTP